MRTVPIELSRAQRQELEKRVRSRKVRAGEARIARCLLLLADGQTYQEISDRLGCSHGFVSQWKRRFLAEGLAGLYTRHPGRKARRLTARMQAKILAATQKSPPDGSTHWSTRRLAQHLGIDHMMVHRAWQRAGIQPHRMERYMASNDPDFERKAAEIIGLYLRPPQHAAVFCVDEKTAIQALDRRDPILPLSPGRAERHGFEYIRNGTLSLYAALDTATGEVVGKPARRHTSQEFVAFLHQLVAQVPEGREIHIILDNLSAHKTQKVQDFLAEHPHVHFHFTPTYASWLNQIELWFSKIERDLIHRGIFTSTRDLAKKLLRYIRRYNTQAKPFKWSYSNPSHRIDTSISTVTVH